MPALGRKQYFLLIALVFLYAGPAAAALASGSKELVRLTKDSPTALTAGSKSLFFSGEPELVAELSSGTARALIGFYSELAKEQWAWLSPEFEAWRFKGQLIGISTGMPAPLLFSQPVLLDTLSALRVYRIRNRAGHSLNEEIVFSTVSYDGENNRLAIFPSTTSWEYNSIYRVDVSTGVLSEDGVPAVALDFTFATRFKYDQNNVVKTVQTGDTAVKMAQEVFPTDGYLRIDTAPVDALLAAANAAFQGEYSGGLSGSITGIDYCDDNSSDGNCVKDDVAFPQGTLLVTLPYDPAAIANPRAYILNEAAAKWEPLPTAARTSATVSAYAPHLSFFMAGSEIISGLGQTKVYPSPFRPNGPDAGIGAGKTGTDTGGITFVAPDGSNVEVYTARGALVWEGANSSGGQIVWDTRTKGGNKAASGIYLYLVRSPGSRRTGKFAIIR